MLLTVFEKYIFLQSLGWGIANSLWQAALLFILYKFVITAGKQLSSLFRYHFSLMLLFVSFTWFIATVIQNYFAILHAGTGSAALNWLNMSENFTRSLQWLSVAYFIVLGVHLVSFIKKLQSLFLLKNSDFVKAPVDIRLFTEQTAFHLGIHKKVSIWLSEKAGVPSVIGFFKPVILLPVSAVNNLTAAQAEAIILHELAHIRRNDYLINFVQCCIEMILFFNPFAKLLGTIARKERENCCDDWVMSYQYNKHDYAAALLLLEQNRFAPVQFALAATNGKKNLLQRIKRLFADEPSVYFSFSQKLKLLSVFCTILVTVLFTLPVANKKATAVVSKAEKIISPASPAIAVKASLPQVIVMTDKPTVAKAVIKHNSSPLKKQLVPVATEAPAENEYNTALINEELLNQENDLQLQEMAMPAAHTETELPGNRVFVKIEEEQSGLKEKCTYIVELNNNNGQPEIKPLIALKKGIKEVPAKASVKIVPGKKITTKKRTTT